MAKNLIFINGPMGVGKSATCRQLLDLLQPAAYLDGDWCWMMKPWTVNARTIAMAQENIVFVLRQYLEVREIETALLRKSLIGRTIPFPVTFQAMASISALPRAEKRFIMAMRIW
ncbi:hypothetical protein JMM63_20690, partial [Rhodovulum sulfidophilum]|uniref:hypothetical protein n=1 Tax=Rhodovulum sulfidophilum TaxID=35806 RepID=UPI00192329B7